MTGPEAAGSFPRFTAHDELVAALGVSYKRPGAVAWLGERCEEGLTEPVAAILTDLASTEPNFAYTTTFSFAEQLVDKEADPTDIAPLVTLCNSILDKAGEGNFNVAKRRAELDALAFRLQPLVVPEDLMNGDPPNIDGTASNEPAVVVEEAISPAAFDLAAPEVPVQPTKRESKLRSRLLTVASVLGVAAAVGVGIYIMDESPSNDCNAREAQRPTVDPLETAQEYQAAADWLETNLDDTTTLYLESQKLTCTSEAGMHLSDELIWQIQDIDHIRPHSGDRYLRLILRDDGELDAFIQAGINEVDLGPSAATTSTTSASTTSSI